MARRRVITDEQILEAARTVFLADGPAAPTSVIADQAGVSEASIFKRFGTKQGLFCAAMRPSSLPDFLVGIAGRAGEGELEETLTQLGVAAVGFFRQIIPRMMLLWSNQIPPAEAFGGMPEHPIAASARALGDLLEAEAALGRIVAPDPVSVARIFMGALAHYAFSEAAGVSACFGTSEEDYVRTLVATLLRGVAAPPGQRA